MVPAQIPGPTQQPNTPPTRRPKLWLNPPRPNPRPKLYLHPPRPNAYNAFREQMNMQHEVWIQRNTHRFHRLILFGERQPSNGDVRKVDPPDGETNFAVAYGDGPDDDLRSLLENIYAEHGEVIMQHDGRDSTGKHWIKCFSRPRPGSSERPSEKAIICVSSKLELATIPRPRNWGNPSKGKNKEQRGGNGWPPRVPGAVKGAPENLFWLPWFDQLRWLEPAAAEALRRRMEAEACAFSRWEQEQREAQNVRGVDNREDGS